MKFPYDFTGMKIARLAASPQPQTSVAGLRDRRRFTLVSGIDAHRDLQIAVQGRKHLHQSIQGEAPKIGVTDTRKVRCSKSSQGGGLMQSGMQVPRIHSSGDPLAEKAGFALG